MRYLAASAAVLGLAATSASAAITATWVPIAGQAGGTPYPAAAFTNDPNLANQETWDLRVTTDGNWASAGMRAVLSSGQFYNHALGGNTRPNPAFFPIAPALEFDTYATAPGDTGASGAPSILGGFPEGDPVSMSGPVISVSWGDLVNDPPGNYAIFRMTFPRGNLPNVININDVGQTGNFSRTSQVNPDSTAQIPDIPEPTTLGLVAAAGLLALRRRK